MRSQQTASQPPHHETHNDVCMSVRLCAGCVYFSTASQPLLPCRTLRFPMHTLTGKKSRPHFLSTHCSYNINAWLLRSLYLSVRIPDTHCAMRCLHHSNIYDCCSLYDSQQNIGAHPTRTSAPFASSFREVMKLFRILFNLIYI